MNVKVVSVIVCLWALAITSTEAGLPKCCMTANRDIKPRTLKRVVRCELQRIDDRCEINALVLYVKGFKKPICAHPRIKQKLDRIRRESEKNKRDFPETRNKKSSLPYGCI